MFTFRIRSFVLFVLVLVNFYLFVKANDHDSNINDDELIFSNNEEKSTLLTNMVNKLKIGNDVVQDGEYGGDEDKGLVAKRDTASGGLSIGGESSVFQGTLFKLAETQLIDSFEKLQGLMKQKNLECMPQSIFYNGTCIYISSKHQKLSWKHAERFCRKLPLNTTFLVIQNEHKYQFLRRAIVKLREKEKPNDQLVFYIGFNYSNNEWKWINNLSLTKANLSIGKYWWDYSGSHGDCGSLALLKSNEMIMRSAPCFSTSSRFMCEYNLNPCYMNDICGPRGRCVNLYYKFYCDCKSSMFYEGKYCEKLNFRGIQTIIGLVIIILLTLGIFCNSRWFNKIWHYYFGKRPTKIEETTDEVLESPSSAEIKFPDSNMEENHKDFRHSISNKVKKNWRKFLGIFDAKNFSYLILIIMTFALVIVQILFSHHLIKFDAIEQMKNQKRSKDMCMLLTKYYMLEDLVYLPASLLFLLILYTSLKSRRFNKYIMFKFKNYFKTSHFKEIQEKQREERMKKIQERENKLKEQKCGYCRFFGYKCCAQKFCDCFCCLFCCSCCVPPSSNTRCFLWYCCCLGWKQTDFYKILSTVRKVFYYIFYILFCIPIWKGLINLTKKKKLEKLEREKKEKEIRRMRRNLQISTTSKDQPRTSDTMSADLDQDENFDIDDYDSSNQTLNRNQIFPLTPFSTSNRAQSAAVYIIYTYDVLNIFMTVYTGYVTPISLPLLGDLSSAGVLVILIIQFLQVVMIGVKFYPILVVADADPNTFICLISTIYMMFIWIFRFLKKSFCSKTDAFVSLTISKLSSQLNSSFVQSLSRKYNASNIALGLFTDDDNPNEKYLSAMKSLIPSVFKEYFGKYRSPEQDIPVRFDEYDTDVLPMSDESKILSMTTSSSYYVYSNPMLATPTTTTLASIINSNSSQGFRSNLKNKTLTSLKTLKGFYYERDEGFMNLVSVLENLPLYITLSYLLVRYGMLFMGCLLDQLIGWSCKKPSHDSISSNADSSYSSSSQLTTKTMSHNAIVMFDTDSKSLPRSLSRNFSISFDRSASSKNADKLARSISRFEESDDKQKLYDDLLKDLNRDYKEKNTITDQIVDRQNHNYLYIRRLFNDYSIFEQSKDAICPKSSVYRFSRSQPVSYMMGFFEKNIYHHVPHMKYSKQFVNTYTVAFMVIYFFTLFGFRLSNIFGNALVGTIEVIFKFIFKGILPSIDLEKHNFNTEFRMACLLTSLITFWQILLGIRNFHNDLIKLHKGDKFFNSDLSRYSTKEYANLIKNRIKDSTTIASDSLHFPGYLVAHLVYGYVLLFIGFFALTLITKLLYHVNGFWQSAAQLLLPLFILFAFKFVIIKFLIKSVFLKGDTQRITNLAPFFMLSYFNFFFDCFLGLVACMSRVWQTTLISLVRLPRLDKSMFNSQNDILLKRLDKGHLSYINYVRMEHWYNNPVLNGFCEMLIESMFFSQVYKSKYDALAKTSFSIRKNTNDFEHFDSNKLTSRKVNFSSDSTLKPTQSRILMRQMISQSEFHKEYNVVEKIIDVPFRSNSKKHIIVDDSGAVIDLNIKEPKKVKNEPKEEEENEATDSNLNVEENMLKEENTEFNYKSFLRLRNLICLCLLLKKNPGLAKYRLHYLLKIKEEEEKIKKFKVQSFSEYYSQTINKNFEKLKRKLNLSKSGRTRKFSN